MTSKMTRAAFVALMIAASPFVLSLHASAQVGEIPQTEPPKPGDHSHDGPPPKSKGNGPVANAAVSKALVQAQKDFAAQKLPEALTDAKTALAASTSDYDKVASNQYIMIVSHAMKDDATAAAAAIAAADAAMNVPNLPDDSKKEIFSNGAIFALTSQQLPKAVTYAKVMLAMNLNDARSQQIISQALYNGGDTADTITFTKQQVAAAVAAHQRPSLDTLNLLLNSQIKSKDEAGAEDTMERLIEFYNNPNDWQRLIDVAISQRGVRDLDYIYLGRLLFALGVKVSQQNADAVGQTASHLGFYGDAVNAAKNGGTGFPDDTAKAANDMKGMTAQIAAEQAQNGLYNIKLAEALYSYGMYAQAETAAKLAQTKGGVTDSSEVGIVLGQAQVAQDKYGDAIATFGQVTGGGPATPRIVRLWTTFAKNKMNPPGPTPNAAPH
jgi:hypothetical protein